MAASRKKENHILEDLARVAEGAFGTVAGFRNELQNTCKTQAERLKGRLDIPTREDMEVIKAMQAKILKQQQDILERLEVLEKASKKSHKS